MKSKILNFPNIITLLRIFILTPFAGIAFLMGAPITGVIISILTILSDVLDGYIARKYNLETKLGAVLDPASDTLFFTIIAFVFLYLGYLNWAFIAFLTAHRFTRGILSLHSAWYGKGFYTPTHIKITGMTAIIYTILIPFFVMYFGQQKTDTITWWVYGTTYAALLISIFVALILFKKGKLKVRLPKN